jgi:hypothetical protein
MAILAFPAKVDESSRVGRMGSEMKNGVNEAMARVLNNLDQTIFKGYATTCWKITAGLDGIIRLFLYESEEILHA